MLFSDSLKGVWLIAAALTSVPAGAGTEAEVASYEVQCAEGTANAEACVVDKVTYVGWRTYHGHCFQCHGGSGLGSTFAPALVDRFNQRVDYARFLEVLELGYTGQVGAMPAFAKNPTVTKDRDALYRYLRARADGALPPGRPKRKREE